MLIENPWNSAMWDCKQSQRFFHKEPQDLATLEPMECVKIDQCMFGLCDRDNGHLLHMKPTGLLTASREVKRRLAWAKCDGDHLHQQLDTKKRCVAAQEWPPSMCRAILEGFVDELDYLLTLVAFPAESHVELEINSDDDENEERTYLDRIITDEDLAILDDNPDYADKKKQEEWEVVYQEGEVPPPPDPGSYPITQG